MQDVYLAHEFALFKIKWNAFHLVSNYLHACLKLVVFTETSSIHC